MQELLRQLPAVDRLLGCSDLTAACDLFGRNAVVRAIRQEIDRLRGWILADSPSLAAVETAVIEAPQRILSALEASERTAYPAVINATGVLLHTNLGRAPLSQPLPEELGGYLALEYDLATGKRGQRLAPIRDQLAETFAAESAVMANNNAAALLLLLACHCKGHSVVVSRGQLIEIGGSFRLPDVMAASGSSLLEVGCTNRTHLSDFERAISESESVAAILVAHPSNYRVVGFTTEPEVSELAELAHRNGLPLFVDQGCGAVHDLRRWGLTHEPTVDELLQGGADAVCFSGDKLLGGPQAGIVVGASAWVEPLGRHPLYRALRPDKTALAWMGRTLAAHRRGDLNAVPVYRMLDRPLDDLRRSAQRISRALRRSGVRAQAVASRATVGGGSAPTDTLASYAVQLHGDEGTAERLRMGRPPVIARFSDGQLLVDLKAVLPEQERTLTEALRTAYETMNQESH